MRSVDTLALIGNGTNDAEPDQRVSLGLPAYEETL